jgi:hypothetical protein
MTRLYEEVLTRLEEMAMITVRSLKLDGQVEFAIKFNPLEGQREHDFPPVEIVSSSECIGGYDYREGSCFGMETQKDLRRIQ